MTESTTKYTTLDEMQARKAALRAGLRRTGEQMGREWQSLLRTPEAMDRGVSPSRRLKSMMSFGAGAIDAFVLGFKLYRKFKR